MTRALLWVEHLTMRFGGLTAVDDVSFSAWDGEITGIIGPNGAGKSTLFKLITGIMRPSAGSLALFGGGIEAARAASRIAYMPQNEALDWDFPISVREVAMSGRLGRLRAEGGIRRFLPGRFVPEVHHDAVAHALDAVQLTHLAGRPIGALSGGQRKRALLARALAQEADLLLLDEALAGVDHETEDVLNGILLGLRDRGRTLLMITHDLATAARIADRVVLLDRRVVAVGAPDEILGNGLLDTVDRFGLPAALGAHA